MAENGKAKYYALMEEMKTDILSGKIRPGEKLPSENQLSVRYGLSRHTVRKALGILAGDGYIESFQGKGTFCADVLRQIHGTGNIAVVTTYISDYIFPRLIQGIDEVLSDNGYSIILKNTGNSRQKEARFLEELISKGIDGLIIEPSKSELLCRHVSLYETLDKYQIPYIFIQGLYTEMQEKPHILMDDAGGGYLVTKHLLDSGRRNIAGFFKADDRQGIERHKGYVKALQEHEIAYDPDKVVWFHTEDRRKKPALMVRNMVRQNSFPDGIVCYNDQIAVQVMEELERQGAQITEVCYDSLIVFLLKETLKTDLDSCLDCYMLLKFLRVTSIQNHVIFIIIFFYQNINISLAYVLYIFCDLVNRISIDLPSEFHLSLNLIALCYSYVSHIVGYTAYTDMAALHDTNCSTHPGCQTLLDLFVCPVSCNDFSLDSHAGYHMAKLTAAVCGLVLIHKVHINGVIGDFHIELCMKMAQRFAILFKAKDPGFCRGKCVHPRDHAGTVFICIGIIKGFTDQLICDQRWFPYNLKRKYTGFIQFLYDDL